MSERPHVEVTDWISPRDSLPPEGVTVEIAVLPDMAHISRAKRLGHQWWVHRTCGLSYCLHQPPEPAFWRLVVGTRPPPVAPNLAQGE